MRPHLSEFQRRLWLGAEAAELGPGGVAIVAEASGVAADTVRRGRKEAADGTGPGLGRSRRPGGGRKRAEDRDEQLIAAFESLIDPVTRGDPMSPLRWTAKSIRALTGALRDRGHTVSDIVTRRLLRERGYSLQANAKTTEGGQHPDRDAQFAYLNDQATDHLATGDPVISVDTKKKELVGAYKNNGREWQPKGEPEQVKVHDFIDTRTGQGQPVRGVRRGHQHRVGVGGHRPRHGRVRGEHHRNLVATDRKNPAPQCDSSDDQCGRRRLQRVPDPAVEDRTRRVRRRHRPHRSPCATCRRAPAIGSGTGAVTQYVRSVSSPRHLDSVHAVLPHTAHRRRSPPAFGFPRQSRKGLGATTFPERLTRPRWSGEA